MGRDSSNDANIDSERDDMNVNCNSSCLCGAVRVSATLKNNAVVACHCTQCQRWTGGGPLYAIRAEDVVFHNRDNIGLYHASAHGERGYCRICGTTLYWTMQGKSPQYLPVGLLDDQSGLSVQEEIFVDYRPSWLSPYPGATQSTEAEQLRALEEYLKNNQ